MRENNREICMTCTNAKHAGLLTSRDGIYVCDAWIEDLRGQSGCNAFARILVNGTAVGCLDCYERNHQAYAEVWRYELEEDGKSMSMSQEEARGVRPGVDFPATM